MTARIVTIVWLLVVWEALWGDLSIANVASGLLVGLALTLAFPVRRPSRAGQLRLVPLVQLLAYFAWKLVEANVIVAWEVITPSNEKVNEAIVAVPLTGASDLVVATVANMISLTPGTLTLEIERRPTVLYVHVLHLRTIEEVRADVIELELRVLRALGSDEAVALAEERRAVAGPAPGEEPAP
jgi:multicomponent Na+:H+ antiporter subunit E